jgi:hypothetical protein
MIKTTSTLLFSLCFLRNCKNLFLNVLNTVNHELPFGILDKSTHRIFAEKKLADFNFRYAVFEKCLTP